MLGGQGGNGANTETNDAYGDVASGGYGGGGSDYRVSGGAGGGGGMGGISPPSRGGGSPASRGGGMGGISLVMQILYTAWAGFGQGGDPVAISRMVIHRLQISACVVGVYVSHAPCVLT